MFHSAFHTLPSCLVLTAAAVAQIPPPLQPTLQTTVNRIDRDYNLDLGDSQYGIHVAMDTAAESRVSTLWGAPYSASVRIDDSTVGRVRLGGYDREAAAVTRFGVVGGLLGSSGIVRSYSAGFSIRIAGQTVMSPTFSGTQTTALTWTPVSATYTFLDATVPVPTPLGFPVYLNLVGRAHGSINATLAVDPPNVAVDLIGNARCVTTGVASASVSAIGASVGIAAELRLLNTRLTPTIGVSYANGPAGTFQYRVEALRFLISLFATVGPFSASLPIVDETFGVREGTRTLF